MRRTLVLATMLATLGARPLWPQSGDRWQIALGPDEYAWDVRLMRLEGDTLWVRQADSSLAVPVARISEMRLIRKTEMRAGDGAATMSALTGRDDEIYDLGPLDFAARLRTVQQILLYHPPDS